MLPGVPRHWFGRSWFGGTPCAWTRAVRAARQCVVEVVLAGASDASGDAQPGVVKPVARVQASPLAQSPNLVHRGIPVTATHACICSRWRPRPMSSLMRRGVRVSGDGRPSKEAPRTAKPVGIARTPPRRPENRSDGSHPCRSRHHGIFGRGTVSRVQARRRLGNGLARHNVGSPTPAATRAAHHGPGNPRRGGRHARSLRSRR